MAESNSTVNLKLLIDTRDQRVLFAEAGKDCVNFLFYMLSFPVSTLINLFGKKGMVGSLGNLYESVENLKDSYILPNKTKDTLLRPVAPLSAASSVPQLAFREETTAKKFYRCSNFSFSRNCDGVSDDPRAVCPNCRGTMATTMPYVAPPRAAGQVPALGNSGFVKDVVTYMVMDDLVVKPMSAISSITLLNKFNIKEVGALEEKEVKVGMDEAVKLLKASLHSKKVLTDVFLSGTD